MGRTLKGSEALQRRFGLAGVEPGLELAANRLPAREHALVADPPRGQLHEPDVLVALTMAAGVRRGLVEGPQAVAIPLSPH